MAKKEYTPEEFYQLAYKMGLTPREVRTLRENGLFPPTSQVGKGQGRGKRYYYTDKSIDELKTLVHWRKQPQARNLQDLRWYLWLFGGWDWLWDDIRKDLLKLFPKGKLDKSDQQEATDRLGNIFSKGRSKLFKRTAQREMWRLVAPSLITPFVYNHIAQAAIPPRNRTENHEIIDDPVYTDSLLGAGSYNIYKKLKDNGLYSLSSLEQSIKESTSEAANTIRPRLQEIESAWDQDENLKIIKRIVGMRPLRSFGIHRIPRIVSVSSLLLFAKMG